MKNNQISRFKISKLWGYQDVDISFDDPVKILIGENGQGKTTILNALYYVLNKDFENLNKIKFEQIELYFSNKKISFSHNELSYYLDRPKRYQSGQFYQIISKELQLKDIENIKNVFNDKLKTQEFKQEYIVDFLKKLGLKINAPSSFIYDNIQKLISEYEAIRFQSIIQIIEKEITNKILYFPTYRRIESQLNLPNITKELQNRYPLLDEDEFSELNIYNKDLIQFGMDDVKNRISNLTQEITQKSLIGFSNITGDLLSQLANDFSNVSKFKPTSDEKKLTISLSRLGNRISANDKTNIINYIKSGKTSNKGLLFLINKLIELYNEQKDLDTAIKNFVSTCNNYLSRKKMFYNESNVTLGIIRDNAINDTIDLDQLSSGEKQIVSLFSKIYLEKDSNYIILFDEPELSLSLFWQEKLLPDIVKSNKCNFLLAVTHSPFIYHNDLDKYTSNLDDYFIK